MHNTKCINVHDTYTITHACAIRPMSQLLCSYN